MTAKVIGIMSIEMAGGVYCPLSPRDPQQRLHALVEQTRSHLVLLHWMSRDLFEKDIVTVDVDVIVNADHVVCGSELEIMANVKLIPESIAYVIFTSGSTGAPKAVS